jgi:chromosome segregation ATPase
MFEYILLNSLYGMTVAVGYFIATAIKIGRWRIVILLGILGVLCAGGFNFIHQRASESSRDIIIEQLKKQKEDLESQRSSDKKDHERKFGEIRTQNDGLKQKAEDLQEKLESSLKEINVLRGEVKHLTDKNNEIEAELKVANSRLAEYNSELNKAHVEIQNLQENLKISIAEARQLREEVLRLHEGVNHANKQIKDLSITNESLNSDLVKVREDLALILNQVSKLEKKPGEEVQKAISEQIKIIRQIAGRNRSIHEEITAIKKELTKPCLSSISEDIQRIESAREMTVIYDEITAIQTKLAKECFDRVSENINRIKSAFVVSQPADDSRPASPSNLTVKGTGP